MIAATILTFALMTSPSETPYGNQVASLPEATAKKLAEANVPIRSGAMGRNKPAYFHVRFQLGMHHLADYGLITRRADAIDRFMTAAEYSIQHQLPSGEFEVVVPPALKSKGTPSVADRASGAAFFSASLGLGILALQTNDWFQESSQCASLRGRLATILTKLPGTLDYLKKHRSHLEQADRQAPNRLLFDALAFITLGKILQDAEAIELGASFVDKAVLQVEPQEGYFIEGGGYDSSYNAVATALAIRLHMLGWDRPNLHSVCIRSVSWQKERVLPTGEVSTKGNTRVRPNAGGESFLGRKKDVDVARVVETFFLASKVLDDSSAPALIKKIINHYESRTR